MKEFTKVEYSESWTRPLRTAKRHIQMGSNMKASFDFFCISAWHNCFKFMKVRNM